MEAINLNLIPNGTNPVVHCSQYDEGREFRFNLFDGASVFVLDGTEDITCDIKKPDGNIVTAAVPNTEDDYIIVTTTLQMCACSGNSLGTINISKGGVNLYTLNFVLYCERSPLENGIESDSAIHNLNTMVDEMVAEDVATQYDSANVIFDNEPTDSHGIGYTVTSQGIKTAIDNAFDYDNTASGSIVHIEDGADNIPVKSLVSEIVATQSGSGTPSPSNPRAISGFSSGVITRCGKNLFNEIYPSIGTLQYMNIFVGKGKFTMSTDLPTRTDTFANLFFLANKVSSGADSALNGVYNNRPVTVTSTDGYVTLAYRYDEYNPENYHSQIEYGNQATTYEPYNGNTYTFTFGQTVYGGHFDNKGNLVVTHDIIDLGDLTYTYYTSGAKPIFYGSITGAKVYSDGDTINAICSCYDNFGVSRNRTNLSSLLDDNQFSFINNGTNLTIRNDSYTDADVFKTAMSGQKVVYELATPITLAITSQDIPTLLGENNIFSNCGDVEVTYYTYKSNDILDFINSEIGKKNGTNIPIEENSQDSIKDYIDNVSLSGLSDTDISGETSGQILAFDGAKWVNTNQIVVKYEEKDIAFDSSGEGTLYFANGYILGLKDIPSDSLYIGYITYMAGTKTMVKGFNRSATSFDSTVIANTTRKIGIYYLDYITTQ